MKILKKQFLILLLSIALFSNPLYAQQETSNGELAPPAQWTVQNHKDQLKLTLMMDSIQLGSKVHKINFQQSLTLSFESEYLKVKDDIYIRIFLARNQEYGKKFYSWKWDYLRKEGGKYNKMGSGQYAPIVYNQPITMDGSYGQGIGIEGESDYLMFYYRYRLE